MSAPTTPPSELSDAQIAARLARPEYTDITIEDRSELLALSAKGRAGELSEAEAARYRQLFEQSLHAIAERLGILQEARKRFFSKQLPMSASS